MNEHLIESAKMIIRGRALAKGIQFDESELISVPERLNNDDVFIVFLRSRKVNKLEVDDRLTLTGRMVIATENLFWMEMRIPQAKFSYCSSLPTPGDSMIESAKLRFKSGVECLMCIIKKDQIHFLDGSVFSNDKLEDEFLGKLAHNKIAGIPTRFNFGGAHG